MATDQLNLVLPGNFRYQPKDLQPYFGYDHLYATAVEVEVATLEVLAEIGVITTDEIAALEQQCNNDVIILHQGGDRDGEITGETVREALAFIRTSEIDRIERQVTHHDVRALVMKIQEIVGRLLARWVHVPLTSYDPLDTGRILQFSRAYRNAIKPAAVRVVRILADKVKEFAAVLQIGRTHGQHALPITVGFWLATILSRIIANLEELDRFNSLLEGKISGAVGAHNAQIGLKFAERCGKISFEERILAKLKLKPARISTQILPPERLAYFLFSATMLSAAFGQLGRDCRQLMRSEIGEVTEAFEEGQTGSSTMAHKRNPINFENLEGTWLKNKNEFGKVMDGLISEHQRDLVGSTLARDYPIILVNLQNQLNTLLREDKKTKQPFLVRISIDQTACRRNFGMNAHLILAEPLYIALQMAGYQGDAHHFVNHSLTPLAAKNRVPLIEVFEKWADDNPDLDQVRKRIPPELIELLYHPERYIGDAEEQSLAINALSERYLTTVA